MHFIYVCINSVAHTPQSNLCNGFFFHCVPTIGWICDVVIFDVVVVVVVVAISNCHCRGHFAMLPCGVPLPSRA